MWQALAKLRPHDEKTNRFQPTFAPSNKIFILRSPLSITTVKRLGTENYLKFSICRLRSYKIVSVGLGLVRTILDENKDTANRNRVTGTVHPEGDMNENGERNWYREGQQVDNEKPRGLPSNRSREYTFNHIKSHVVIPEESWNAVCGKKHERNDNATDLIWNMSKHFQYVCWQRV